MNTASGYYEPLQKPHTAPAAGASTAMDMDIDIRSTLLMLWRRKYVIFSIMLIGLSLTVIGLSFIQPLYTARSLVMIEDNSIQKKMSDELKLMVGDYVRFDNSLIMNEIEVIKSRSMARDVIGRLNLMANPDLNPYYRRFVVQDGAEESVKTEGFKSLSIYKDDLASLPPEIREQQINIVVNNFLENLDVRMITGSFAIQIQYSSSDPNQAALVANAMADIYIEKRLETKFNTSKKFTTWLDQRLKELREQVRNSDLAVAEYAAKNNLAQGTRTIISAEQLTALNSQLIDAKAERAEAQARFEQVQHLSAGDNNIDSSVEIINSGFIQGLKSEEGELLRRQAELSERYGPRHPSMIEIRSEIADHRNKMTAEMNKIAESINNELSVADARVKALEASLDEVMGVRNTDNEKMIKLNELTREAESSRLIFDNFLQTYKRSDEQDKLQEPEARVLSYAAAPNRAAYPDRMLFLALATAISLFLGIFISFFLEKMDNTFRSAGQLERNIGFPCFALIPQVENMDQRALAKFVLDKPSSIVAESVRTLRTVLRLRGSVNGKSPKIVTITSSFPGEGKTTLSCWLGRLAAKSGDKVILIDGDLRRPNVHKTLGASNDVTLIDYLTDKATLEETIRKDDPSGLHVIYAKAVPNSALDLISGDRMRRLVESLGQAYDMVIIDSPACLAVSDARVFSMMSDQTIYSVAWDRTPREVVSGGVKQFADMGYTNLSLVLTNVDVKRHVRYGYGDTIYYYGNYSEEPERA